MNTRELHHAGGMLDDDGILGRIKREYDERGEPMTTAQLACRLGIQESALAGMLQYLSRKGRLEYCDKENVCRGCDCGSCRRQGCCSG